MQTVCRAVHFIHGNLVIHSDLKPANVLVTRDGEPKILDFGIARVFHEDALTQTGSDMTQTIALTPEYASPEQILGERITIHSDVYSLGILLCELLTGDSHYRLRVRSMAQMRLAIREQELPQASALAAHILPSGEGTDSATNQSCKVKNLQARKWSHQLKGDLDAIVAMALRKEPDQRYASALQLGEDLGRYLKAYPVIAAPDTWTYRTGKFIKRNLSNVALAGVALLIILGFATALFFQKSQTEQERDKAQAEQRRAQQAQDVLVDLLKLPEPFQKEDGDFDIRTILARAEASIDDSFLDRPGDRSELMHLLGRMYTKLGMYGKADAMLQQALSIRLDTFGARSEAVGQTAKYYSRLLVLKGDYTRAEDAVRIALQALGRNGGRHGS